MTDAQVIGLAIFLPILLVACGSLVHRVDKSNPRRDYVAERHRKISHRGFKTRAGIRS